jgi:hypothetical protein
MRTAFESFDTKKDGVISIDEFKSAFSQFNYTDQEMDEMFSYLVSILKNSPMYVHNLLPNSVDILLLPDNHHKDVNGCNEITYTEFIAATLDLHGRVEEKRLAEAFGMSIELLLILSAHISITSLNAPSCIQI